MTRSNVRKQGWVFLLFSPDFDDRLSLNFHRFDILYISCGTSVGLGHYCLPKVSNGFNREKGSKIREIIKIVHQNMERLVLFSGTFSHHPRNMPGILFNRTRQSTEYTVLTHIGVRVTP